MAGADRRRSGERHGERLPGLAADVCRTRGGGSAGGRLDGLSLVPTLTGRGDQEQHDYLYWEFHERGGKRAIRQGNWKAVQLNMNRTPGPVELYDLGSDVGEEHDVAAEHPEVVGRLEGLMMRGGWSRGGIGLRVGGSEVKVIPAFDRVQIVLAEGL